jgi:hypothetical protein
VVLLLLVANVAFADSPAVRRRLSEGERRYVEQDYRGAVESLQGVVGDPVATVEDRARAWEYLGLSWLVMGKKQKAREAFEELLAIDPQYVLSEPSRSPKLRAFFEEVRGRFVPGYSKPAGEVELLHSAPSSAQAGRPIEIAAQVARGASNVEDVSLRARRQGLLTFEAQHMRREDEGHFRLTYPLPRDSGDYQLEYFLEARDSSGRVVARLASPERPIALSVRGVIADNPWYKRWYVWTIVGAVTVGVVVGVSVGVSGDAAASGSLPPGKVELGLRF